VSLDISNHVGVDAGERLLGVDDDGEVRARTRVPHDLLSPTAGTFEHDVDRAWRADVIAALKVQEMTLKSVP
jgi:xylulokinase